MEMPEKVQSSAGYNSGEAYYRADEIDAWLADTRRRSNDMTIEQALENCSHLRRAKILLQAMVDMMEKQEGLHYVKNIFELTAIWDGEECDGYCLYEEAKELLEAVKE